MAGLHFNQLPGWGWGARVGGAPASASLPLIPCSASLPWLPGSWVMEQPLCEPLSTLSPLPSHCCPVSPGVLQIRGQGLQVWGDLPLCYHCSVEFWLGCRSPSGASVYLLSLFWMLKSL